MGMLSPPIHAALQSDAGTRFHAGGRKGEGFCIFSVMSGTKARRMCDEYYDARMKAFWRALAEADEHELDEKVDEPIVQPLVLEIAEPQKAKPKTLVR